MLREDLEEWGEGLPRESPSMGDTNLMIGNHH